MTTEEARVGVWDKVKKLAGVKKNEWEPLTTEDCRRLGIPLPYKQEKPKPLGQFDMSNQTRGDIARRQAKDRRDASRLRRALGLGRDEDKEPWEE